MIRLQKRKGKAPQKGTILVTALILLLVLTMLGVTAMNTTSLQEKMSANVQAIQRAFQTAESAIDITIDDGNAFVIGQTVSAKIFDFGDYNAGANLTITYLQATNPPRSQSAYSVLNFAAYQFDVKSEAGSQATNTASTVEIPDNAAKVILHSGVYQIGYKI